MSLYCLILTVARLDKDGSLLGSTPYESVKSDVCFSLNWLMFSTFCQCFQKYLSIDVHLLKLSSPLLFYFCLQALIDQWIDVATTELDANLSKWLYPLLGYRPYIAEVG